MRGVIREMRDLFRLNSSVCNMPNEKLDEIHSFKEIFIVSILTMIGCFMVALTPIKGWFAMRKIKDSFKKKCQLLDEKLRKNTEELRRGKD